MQQEYAGFWIRTLAALIDTMLLLMIVVPVLLAIYGSAYLEGDVGIQGGWDFLLNYIFPAFTIVIFWIYKSATPGKMITGLKIVDATTGGKPTTGQFIGRYLGYYLSTIPLLLGIIWVAVDRRKQGWHDKLANTVVIHDRRHSA